MGACASSGESLIVQDAYKDKRFNQENDKKFGYRTRNIMCVPVLEQGMVEDEGDKPAQDKPDSEKKVLAVVQLVNKRDGSGWNHDDERTARMLARHVGIFLEQVGGDDD